MHKIGIIGHSQEHFTDVNSTEAVIKNTLYLLASQYGSGEIVFNMPAETGVGLWAAKACVSAANVEELGAQLKFHMFLPHTLENVCAGLLDDQAEQLRKAYDCAGAITITNNDDGLESLKQLVDGSSFVICFWIGKKQGKTYAAVEYALSNNKMVLNGLDGLRMITKNDLKRHRARQ